MYMKEIKDGNQVVFTQKEVKQALQKKKYQGPLGSAIKVFCLLVYP